MKNKNTFFVVLLFAAALCLLLVGCSQDDAGVSQEEELPVISILTIGETDPEALGRVSKALSEITAERIGCRVELRMIREDEYDERIDDLLLESDFADIFVCRNRTTLNKLMAGSYVYRLDRYLARRPGLRAAVDDQQAWMHVKSQGYTYGIPFGNNTASAWGFLMCKDVCDELEIDTASISTLEQLHQVLQEVHVVYPDMIPVVSDYGDANTFADIDLLTEGAGCAVVNGQVVNLCGTSEFLERCTLMQQWYEEGLILLNAQLNQAGRDSWMKDGLAFGSFARLDRYTARELEYALGEPVECIVLEENYYAHNTSEEAFVIYAYTEDVDRCLQVLELIYSEEELLHLCVYGEEGEDYVFGSDGAVLPTEKGTYVNWCWPMRDRIPAPYSSEDPAWYAEMKEEVFRFDNSMVANEIYQCGEVLKKYYEVLCAGAIEPTEGIRRMNEELVAANQEKVRIELENQWFAWRKENGI